LHPRFEPISPDPSCDFCSGRRQPAAIGIDAVYCISLVEQPARTACAAAHFHAIGLCQQAIFRRPQRAKNTNLGAWTSHRAVAQQALARGHQRVMEQSAWQRKLDEECPHQVVLPRQQLFDDDAIMKFLDPYVGKL
jgi:hypothetical protein